jgi:hypothetical protein
MDLLMPPSVDKWLPQEGVVKKDRLTKHWTDWVDYWAVDFHYLQRKEIIKVPAGSGFGGIASLPGFVPPQGELPAFEERWTGGYIFENEWQSFRTRQNRDLELTTPPHTYDKPSRYTVAVKVIDIFGNDAAAFEHIHGGGQPCGRTLIAAGRMKRLSDPGIRLLSVGSGPTARSSRPSAKTPK